MLLLLLVIAISSPLVLVLALTFFPRIILRGPFLYFFPLISLSSSVALLFKRVGLTVIEMPFFEFSISFLTHQNGVIFASLTSLLWTLTNYYSTEYMKYHENIQTFFSYISLSMFCVLCIAFSENMLTMFIFYELLSISTYKLVTYEQTPESLSAGKMYIFTLLTSSVAFLLPGILILHSIGCDLQIGTVCQVHKENIIPFSIGILCITYGLAKMAIMPIHKWLVRAMVAPAPVSAFLHAVAVVKSGVFIFLMTAQEIITPNTQKQFLFPNSNLNWLTCITAISVISSSLMAVREKNIKKLLAYSTISNLSYMALAASTFTQESIDAAFFFMVSHSFSKITLFFFAGIIQKTRSITTTDELNGLAYKMPILSACALINIIGMIGLPPASGFWGKFYILRAAIEGQNQLIVAIICISTFLNAMYFIPMLIKMFSRGDHEIPEKNRISLALTIPPILTSIANIGLFSFPQYLIGILHS